MENSLQFSKWILVLLTTQTSMWIPLHQVSTTGGDSRSVGVILPTGCAFLVHCLVTQTHSMINRAWIVIGVLTGGRWPGIFKRQGMGRGIHEAGYGQGVLRAG